MLHNVIGLSKGNKDSRESQIFKNRNSNVGGVSVNLTNEQREKREQRMRELLGSELGQKVIEEWEVEVFYGYAKSHHRNTHAIKLTNKVTAESITYLKSDIQNMKNADQIVDTLRIFGEVERNHIRFFGNYINAVRALPEMVTEVKDLSLVACARNSEVGFSVIDYYELFLQDYFENKGQYPTRSSNQYQKYVNHGVILDSNNHEYFMNEHGYFPVAIRSGKLRKLFPHIPDQEYRQVIQRLYHLGVLHESIALKIDRDAKRFDRRIKMVDMQIEKQDEKKYCENVFIFNINPLLLEGSN